jgi:hypothetical protein
MHSLTDRKTISFDINPTNLETAATHGIQGAGDQPIDRSFRVFFIPSLFLYLCPFVCYCHQWSSLALLAVGVWDEGIDNGPPLLCLLAVGAVLADTILCGTYSILRCRFLHNGSLRRNSISHVALCFGRQRDRQWYCAVNA